MAGSFSSSKIDDGVLAVDCDCTYAAVYGAAFSWASLPSRGISSLLRSKLDARRFASWTA